MPDLAAFARFEGVEEVAIPVVEPVLDETCSTTPMTSRASRPHAVAPRQKPPAVFQKRRMTTARTSASIDMT